MTRVTWGVQRRYESGVDRGMLYIGETAVPWAGLVSVSEAPMGGNAQPFYLDGQKVLNIPSGENFDGTIEAYAAPIEFAECAGREQLGMGLYAADQPRTPFGFSYRTRMGTTSDPQAGYKIHVVYNAIAKMAGFVHETMTDTPAPKAYSWGFNTTPAQLPNYKPTAHVVISTLTSSPDVITSVENALYGNDEHNPRLPDLVSLANLMGLT